MLVGVCAGRIRHRHRCCRSRCRASGRTATAAETEGKASVVVVGSGLAGLGAGLAAARAGLRVRVVDAAPRRPGEPWQMAPNADADVPLPLEAGQKGIWAEYPNLIALLDGLADGGSEAVLTRPTMSGFYSARGLEVNAPIFGRLPRLPAPLGTLAYTAPLFQKVSPLDQLSALPLIPDLLEALQVGPGDEDAGRLDGLSAEELLLGRGISRELYDAFLRPVLQALLFRPPAELSAFMVLRVLWCYVLKTQASFDVRWFRGPLAELLVRPLVSEIERLGGTVEAGRQLVDVELDSAGSAVAVQLGSAGSGAVERVAADAVVLAAGVTGACRTLENCSDRVQQQLAELLDGLRNLRTTDCMAVRVALDRLCPARFASNVLSGFDGLEETGATFFMIERLQSTFLRRYTASTPGGKRLRGRSLVALDLYGSDRGPLPAMSDREVAEFCLELLQRAEPAAFKGAGLAPGVQVSVLRARNAATHFAPGSRRHRPRQQTSIPNLFVAGDFVKGLEHGSEGLSQERALVSGYAAANLAMDFLESQAGRGGLARQEVLPLSADEPQVALLRSLWPDRRAI